MMWRVAALAAVLASMGSPGLARGGPGRSLAVAIGLENTYDDNILQYSNNQLLDFGAAIHPDRFALSTSDDVALSPAVVFTFNDEWGHGRSRTLRFRVTERWHAKNSIADARGGSLSWRENFRHDRRLSLYGAWWPNFYLRQLFSDNVHPVYSGLSRYRKAEFDLGIASIGWQEPLSPRIHAGAGYQFERRIYSNLFRERDSSLHQLRFGGGWARRGGRAALDAWGAARFSAARAADGDEHPGQTPDDPDVSYHGLGAGLAGRCPLARRGSLRLDGDLQAEWESRHFTSNRPADRYHYRRNDDGESVELGVSLRWRPHWSSRASFRYETNHAGLGSAAAFNSDSGSYEQRQIGLSLDWTGILWKSASTGTRREGDE